jgi:ABC-2 type transport system ATP-binding protein
LQGIIVSEQASSALELRGVHVEYGPKPVLHGLDLTVRPGELYALLGENGAGKTTALNVACGLLRPDRGSARILGHDVFAADTATEARRALAFLPDEPVLYATLSAMEYLEFVGALWSMDAARVRERSRQLIAEMRLEAVGEQWLGTYSRGMRQKIALAGALLHEPRMIVMDEPFTGLDPVSGKQIRQLMERVVADGTSILMSTHQLDTAGRLADRIGILAQGRLVAEGSATEIQTLAAAGGDLETAFLALVAKP